MKINKLICLNQKVFDRLKEEDNASQLIERLLEDYFNKHDVEEMTLEELKIYQKEIELTEEYTNNLKEIKKQRDKIWATQERK